MKPFMVWTWRVIAGAVAWTIIVGQVNAQILWHACKPAVDVKGFYEYTALASHDNQVFVAMQVRDTSTNMWTLRFLKSDDGCQTWTQIDPGFGELAHRDDYHIVALQDLDGTNIYGVSDSGYFIHSADAGRTWSKNHVAPHAGIDINFATVDEGILISESDSNIFYTSDGGNSWHAKPLPMAGWAITARAYGNGAFRVFSYGFGSVYNTNNYWQTYDTTLPLSPRADLNHLPIACKMGFGDTVYAYGTLAVGDPVDNHPFLARSINGGDTWDTLKLPAESLKYISAISDLDRDTIIVAGEGALEYSISYDRGSTWIRDTMVSDTRYLWYVCRKVAFLPSGKPVGLWRQSGRGGGNAGILVGEWKKLGVTTPQADSLRTYMYPNPTTGKITFAAVPAEGVVVISDVCGREVGRAVLDAAGKGNIDLSPLPRGVYSAILMHGTTPLALGRICLTSGR